MPRRSLRPHLNQIRSWVRQGRTDAWVAHQLEVTVREIEQFKRQNELSSAGESPENAAAVDYEEIDLRAEDDALIAAELEAAEIEAERAKAEAEENGEDLAEEPEEETAEEEAQDAPRVRRRGRRGGRARSATDRGSTSADPPIGDRPAARSRGAGRNVGPLEGTFDHGEEGYGLWLDPAIQDNPTYAEHWAGHRPVEVAVEEDRLVIRRIGGEDDTRP